MPDDTSSTTTDMPPPASKKRKRSVNDVPVKISAAPSTEALPPPIMPYPHLVPSYYPMYHQHPPYFLSVGQSPISPSLSPTLASSPQRILPKSPSGTPAAASLVPTYNYYPYPIQVSPQLHPHTPLQPNTPMTYHSLESRNNSVSSNGSATTADQREQARKVSHSAIERRRREKINDKILQLKDLIPSCSDRENLHKMTILQSAIEYITYLKTVIQDLDSTGSIQTDCAMKSPVQPKSMLPKEVEPFTNQFSINQPSNEEEEDDNWSASSSPVIPKAGLKPIDVIKLNQKATSPPTIVIHEHSTTTTTTTSTSTNHMERNMNLENILC